MIEKKPQNDDLHLRRLIHFSKARHALAWFLRQLGARNGDAILMPAYIGWSPHEGSGVFDPIREIGLNPVFYHMDQNLAIDREDFNRKLANYPVRFALIIHYFGFVDELYQELVSNLINKGVVTIEDSAHALLTDLIGLGCGQLGDASVFSLHKMLPVDIGGLLAIRCDSPASKVVGNHEVDYASRIYPWEYDLEEISRRRKKNYEYLADKLKDFDQWIKPLHPILKKSEIPQSLPARIISGSRDSIYHRMNSLGFGVVSLYHTLIDEIDKKVFQAEASLSRDIINMPIHQDVTQVSIDAMLAAMETAIRQCGA